MSNIFGPVDFDSWADANVVPGGWPMDLCRKAWLAAIEKERERCAKLCEDGEELFGPTCHDVARAIRKG